RKSTARKSTGRKTARKSTAKKSTAKKSTAKKSTARKAGGRKKTTARKASTKKKTATRKTAGRKKTAARKTSTARKTRSSGGKLTLFDADGPREQGAFGHVALRVSDLESARAALPPGTPDVFEVGSDGIRLTLVEVPTDVEYDLDHVVLRTADPQATALEYEQ